MDYGSSKNAAEHFVRPRLLVHFLYWTFSRFCFLGRPFNGLFFGWRRLEFIVGGKGDSPGGCEMTKELESEGLSNYYFVFFMIVLQCI